MSEPLALHRTVAHRSPRGAGGRGRVRWYVNRLRCMAAAEIPYRIARALTARAERLALYRDAAVPPPDLDPDPAPWIEPDAGVDPAPYLAAAERLVAGEFDVFALNAVRLGSPPRWNRDPRTGREAPLHFGKLLDYRDPALVGDIKYLWEPNRHLHLVTLAQAFRLSGDGRYFDTLRAHLESWFDACPYRRGPNWSSALEPAIRLLNWAIAWQLLGGARAKVFASPGGRAFRSRWLESIHQHASFVRGYFSLHSSANNHLLGEAAGLFVAALTWPHWKQSGAWLAHSKALLEREALLQTGADGVDREQAVSYHQFAFDFLLLALLAGRAGGAPLHRAVAARMERMLEYLASIMDVAGNVPMFGDSDDGQVVRLSQEPGFCRFRSQLASGALLFGRADFKVKSRHLDDKTRWLFGADAEQRLPRVARAGVRLPVRRAFPDGGYYLLGCRYETAREIRLVADAGALGYREIAAHGHADALAFTLSVAGREMLIDPGTCTYRPDSPWRAYFRGTAAHNTLRVDAVDQSEPGGNFMWLHKARAGCTLWRAAPECDVFEGWHDGYTRLADPVMHRRRITVHKRTRRIVIEDRLSMAAAHDIELFFHCSGECRVAREHGGYVLHQGPVVMRLRPPVLAGSHSRVHRGDLDPVLGWSSSRFDHRRASPTIAWRARLRGDAVLRTEIDC